ncbi:MAG TPA: hypothetical protein VGT04_16185 [Acidobacteriaceae bacterium]|nr:hypothetical protein [Acidobacteriaceae bacterium]
MRFRFVLACGLGLPLLASAFAQQSAQQPTASTAQQQSAPAQNSAPPSLQLHDLAPEPHTPTPQELEAQKEARLRMQLVNVARAQARWGPAESATGMTLNLKETGRQKTAAGTEITYQITGTGFTPDMQLTLVRWPLNQPVEKVMSGIVVDAQGTAVCGIAAPGPAAPANSTAASDGPAAPSCTKTMKPGTPITITTTAAKGEAERVALIASDHKHGAAVSYVPFPMEGSDHGCKIQVILGSKDAELVLVEGQGFQHDTTYTLGTESFGQKHPLTATINPKGSFLAALTPWAPNHTVGDTVVYYQSSTCAPTVNIHWGKDTYKPE